MNSLENTEQEETEIRPSNPQATELEPDDDFENEELGKRQPEACSIDDEGCVSCQ